MDNYLNDLNLTKEQYKAMVFIIYNNMYRGICRAFVDPGKDLDLVMANICCLL